MNDDQCRRCGQPRDTTGRPLWCKACRAARQRTYRAAHPDLRAADLARVLAWGEKHPDRLRAARTRRGE